MLSVLFLSSFWLGSSPTSLPGEILASLEPICQVICLRTCPLRILQNKQSMAKEKLMSVYAWKADVSALALHVCIRGRKSLAKVWFQKLHAEASSDLWLQHQCFFHWDPSRFILLARGFFQCYVFVLKTF